MTDTATLHRLPDGESPFGAGPVFEVILPVDVLSLHGNVIASAGRYEAQQSDLGPEGNISIWSPDYYARGDRFGGWVSLAPWDWAFPGEERRGVPAHDCFDHLRSGVVGDAIYCGMCRREVEV